jgi:hypothetical protein
MDANQIGSESLLWTLADLSHSVAVDVDILFPESASSRPFLRSCWQALQQLAREGPAYKTTSTPPESIVINAVELSVFASPIRTSVGD